MSIQQRIADLSPSGARSGLQPQRAPGRTAAFRRTARCSTVDRPAAMTTCSRRRHVALGQQRAGLPTVQTRQFSLREWLARPGSRRSTPLQTVDDGHAGARQPAVVCRQRPPMDRGLPPPFQRYRRSHTVATPTNWRPRRLAANFGMAMFHRTESFKPAPLMNWQITEEW